MKPTPPEVFPGLIAPIESDFLGGPSEVTTLAAAVTAVTAAATPGRSMRTAPAPIRVLFPRGHANCSLYSVLMRFMAAEKALPPPPPPPPPKSPPSTCTKNRH